VYTSEQKAKVTRANNRIIKTNRIRLFAIMLVFILEGCSQFSSTPVTPAKMSLSSWSDLLASAQAEATRIESKATLQWVSTDFTYDQAINDKPTENSFVFLRPNGTRILVVLEDSVPPNVVKLVPEWDHADVFWSDEQLEGYRSLLSQVKLGPREIVRKMPKNDVDPQGYIGFGLFLDENYEKKFGIRVAWGIVYSNSITHSAAAIYASPQTGEILKGDSK
jgi:hypothetical protein